MRWDIFCQIVDNYGDAGVCWRLARSLTSLHGQDVRIFCDDLPTLNLLASGVDPEIKSRIDIQPWEASHNNSRHPVEAPDVVIEAFGCDLPERYLAGLLIAPKKPLIINLEYLSAESWILDFHQKASPQAHGIPKYFFFPGFQAHAGGILIDPIPKGLTEQPIPNPLEAIWKRLRPDTKRISVFCYPGAPLLKWLEDLAAMGKDYDIVLTHGQLEQLQLSSGHPTKALTLPDSIQLFPIPFVSQDEYDWLLAQCDFNIVRGEDSFVRAQLAGKPFIWHIYPQVDRAHEIKLAAFLDLYLADASQELKHGVMAAMNWAMPSMWHQSIDAWGTHSKAWHADLLEKQADGGLASRLIGFVA
ncbi:elongation factor P maturation arginine rhamnosyltransferase EarP [Polynucleobacter sp. UK-Mo-2m-Kol15]|uniref:elongation factor P maturation arginine rhamnosyltransferase EarP n=1 Tax=Polynucleobacter sp. UK-Mo-2m-Kol15 TaxID=2576916 RepID=UPI001C0C206D|nr:elongation factor P maturation arginine rhamnosyltransferase EarP [Polynucleobacter sp. UK-Mo-2m-Kol15]MBU3575192.1 elongation factor P maturation arginine rhamnosyltransferase EarP [Polynucleobacter sp. UK-Mo-2m-Kol15]